jgi:hypothetical protein
MGLQRSPFRRLTQPVGSERRATNVHHVHIDPALLVIIQSLDGFSGAARGVLTTLIIADLTNGTGRFNLAPGLARTFSGVGALLSILISLRRDSAIRSAC